MSKDVKLSLEMLKYELSYYNPGIKYIFYLIDANWLDNELEYFW